MTSFNSAHYASISSASEILKRLALDQMEYALLLKDLSSFQNGFNAHSIASAPLFGIAKPLSSADVFHFLRALHVW